MSNRNLLSEVTTSLLLFLQWRWNYDLLIKLSMFAVFLFTISLFSTSGAQETEKEWTFREYQLKKPPVKYIRYERSNSPESDGYVLADGAVQKMGYYLRFIKNPPYPQITTNMLVWGLSDKYEWYYGEKNSYLSYGPRKFWNKRQTADNYYNLLDLQRVVCLGLPRPYNDEFIWISDTKFRFGPNGNEFTGSISPNSEWPQSLVYEATEENPYWSKAEITYYYDDANTLFPPSRFIVEFHTERSQRSITNIIHEFEIGVETNAAVHGYYARDFIPDDVEIKELEFMSNHVRYSVLPDGTKVKYKYSNVAEMSKKPNTYPIMVAFLALLVAIPAFILVHRARKKN